MNPKAFILAAITASIFITILAPAAAHAHKGQDDLPLREDCAAVMYGISDMNPAVWQAQLQSKLKTLDQSQLEPYLECAKRSLKEERNGYPEHN